MQVRAISSASDLIAMSNSGTLTGIYDVPEALYHAGPGISVSGLKKIWKSPQHFDWERRNPMTPTPDMVTGSALHCAILQPDHWQDTYCVAPEGIDRRTKDGKARWAEFEAESRGKAMLTRAQFDQVCGMQNSLSDYRTAASLLSSPGVAEASMYWNDGGLLCRGRPDLMTDERVIVDIKTCQDASPDAFARTMVAFKYHWQAAFYLNGYAHTLGFAAEHFVFVAIERDPPHAIAVYRLEDADLHQARGEVAVALNYYRMCLEYQTWPGYPDTVQDIRLPRWARVSNDQGGF